MNLEKGLLVLTKYKILINDSCILFDLVDLNLIQDFFQLEYSFYTTPQVIGEITDETQFSKIEKYISNEILIIDSLGSLESIQILFDEYPGLSFTDSSVLELATRINGMVLSSDKSLRNISKRRNLTVKGFLWIIEELLDKKIISRNTAVRKLRIYPDVNIRAPIKEINNLMDILERKSS